MLEIIINPYNKNKGGKRVESIKEVYICCKRGEKCGKLMRLLFIEWITQFLVLRKLMSLLFMEWLTHSTLTFVVNVLWAHPATSSYVRLGRIRLRLSYVRLGYVRLG